MSRISILAIGIALAFCRDRPELSRAVHFRTNLVAEIVNAWSVLSLFLIPIGGGIPAGVLLARARNIPWPEMMGLYFISDVILACVFEPLMKIVGRLADRSAFWMRFREAFRSSLQKTLSRYGNNLSVVGLVMISFGVDPMTGRLMSAAVGHGFVVGWLIAISGDMIYFTVLMASTLWLDNLLGDGTWTTVIVLVAMTVIPPLIRRFRQNWVRPLMSERSENINNDN